MEVDAESVKMEDEKYHNIIRGSEIVPPRCTNVRASVVEKSM